VLCLGYRSLKSAKSFLFFLRSIMTMHMTIYMHMTYLIDLYIYIDRYQADLGLVLAALGAQQRHHPKHFSFALPRSRRS